MGRIEQLAEKYGHHIATPWQRTVAGAQRVVMLIYDKELERTLRGRKVAFETATEQAGHVWNEMDLAPTFAEWMSTDDYRDEYFASPDDLHLKLEAEFPSYVAERLRGLLCSADESAVVAVFGVGTLLGFSRVSQVLKAVEGDIRGRLVVFFPGQYEGSNYRLLDARDGWNYLAVPITMHGDGGI